MADINIEVDANSLVQALKAGARHSKRDNELLMNSRRKLREIDQHLVDLGTPEDAPEDMPDKMPADMGKESKGGAAKSENPMPAGGDSVWAGAVKAVGDWTLEVLGVPFGGPNAGKDAHGEYFSGRTNLHLDKFASPLTVYYHGYSPEGNPQGDPQIIGQITSNRKANDGYWFRVVLDKTNELARRVWEAAKNGAARASSGSIAHLVRRASDGEILNWPLVELSLFDAQGDRQPANQYAVALPVAKSLYQIAGIEFPDFENLGDETQPEAEAIGSQGAAKAEAANPVHISPAPIGAKDITTMDEKDIAELVAKNVAAALKAQQDLAAQEAKAKADEQARIDEGVKAELAKRDAEAAKGRRLPIGDSAPYQAKFGETWKYDNLDPADNALLIELTGAAQKAGQSTGPRPEAVKALALKLEGEKDDVYQVAKNSMKAAGIKANELNYSTQSGFGDEWIGVAYATRIWEAIRQGTFVAARLMERAVEVPQGFESIVLPLEGADPTFYKVAQTTATNATTLIPDGTVPTSKVATGNKTLSLVKMGARTVWSGEMEEDSIIPFVSQLRMQFEKAGAETLEHVIIDGDTATGATTNINDIAGTPGGTEAFLLVDGFRKSPLVTTTANSRSGGTLTVEDFLETLKLMGLAGKNADKRYTEFILDKWTAWKALELAEVKTRDVFVSPTIENGELTGVYGYKVNASAFMHYANQDSTYGLKANTAGKTDLDTAANNTTGSILAVRFDQWQFGLKRRMTIETQRIPQADATQIVALMRFGLTQRDTEASAITYNLSV